MKKAKDIIKNWGKSIFDTYIKYNSQTEGKLIEHQISPGGDSYIHFQNEGIITIIKQADNRLDFYTSDEEYIISQAIPAVEHGRKAYLDICCGVDKNAVILKFPVYEWFDNYPNCDGEYDRWDTKIIGYHIITFNLSSNTVTQDLFNPN